jgi:hypothetical protein
VQFPCWPVLDSTGIVGFTAFLSRFGVVRPDDTQFLGSLDATAVVVPHSKFTLGKIEDGGRFTFDRIEAPEGSLCSFEGDQLAVGAVPRGFEIRNRGKILLTNLKFLEPAQIPIGKLKIDGGSVPKLVNWSYGT